MQASLLPDEFDDAVALAASASLRGTSGHFDELHARLTTPVPAAGALATGDAGRAGATAADAPPAGAAGSAVADGGSSAGPTQKQTQTQTQTQLQTQLQLQTQIQAHVQAPAQAQVQLETQAQEQKSGQSQNTVAASSPGRLSPVWSQFFSANAVPGWHDLSSRQSRIQSRLREDGATYNVYSEGQQGAREWPLEQLPFLIQPAEWARIERGVQQRARLLNAALVDLYGAQTLLRKGLLPPSLIMAHPSYLRAMAGARPAGGIWLHVLGVDLARGPDGHWWVVGVRTQAPSGLGYLLENRLIIAQQFPEAFRSLKVQRVASAFRTLLQGLQHVSPERDRARVVLLTPGPLSETYFEHVFLARYLGITLVESGDLTVRDQRLYLKTMHGLERVHVLLRRVDDEWLDPLELRADSALGVPGLLQALRAGQVVVANAPGTGVLESPGLTAFWPAVAQDLLKEELLLPATTSWWCGEPAVWAAHRHRLGEFMVAPTFPPGQVTQGFTPINAALLKAEARRALEQRIDADPATYTLQSHVRPSEMPVWVDGRLEPRQAVVRVYAVGDGAGGWRVLPGGLTRVGSRQSARLSISGAAGAAAPAEDAFLSIQRGSASADTWVLTDGNVDRTSLLPRSLQASDLIGWQRAITSRAAENLFWLGRYTERAENAVRLARLAIEVMPSASAPVLGVLHEVALRHGLVSSSVPSPALSSPTAPRLFERSMIQALSDAEGAQSLAYDLQALRDCAEAVRERLSNEHWALIAEAAQMLRPGQLALDMRSSPDVALRLAEVGVRLAAITGCQIDRMTRDDGWRLLSVGRMIERVDTLAHGLAAGFEAGLPALDDGFAFLLSLFDSTITYRAHFQARREVAPLLHLLVLDTDNPRALGWVARTLRERLRKLARHDRAWADSICAELPAPDRWSLEELCKRDAQGQYADLAERLTGCSATMRDTASEISRHLFSHVGASERMIWQ